MARLKSRDRQIPNGFKFYQAATKWTSTPWASFDTIVRSLMNHRRGNAYLAKQNNWATDYDTVAAEVEAYNVLLCQQNGWEAYIVEGTPGPAPPPKSLPQRVKHLAGNLAAGAKTIIDWLGSGGEPVANPLAERRAATCAMCPHNVRGALADWFTVPISEMISRQIASKNEQKLVTSHDDKIGLCSLCDCPLKLKVWSPLQHVLAHLPSETLAQLPAHCWITKKDQ